MRIGNGGSAANSSISIGKGANSLNSGVSIGLGSNCTNNGIAIGVLTTAETNQSMAIGYNCQAGSTLSDVGGARSIALGCRAQALGDYSICIGNDNTIDKNISKTVVLGSDFGGAQNSNALYVAKMTPLQDNDVENAKALYYDLTTREITYGASALQGLKEESGNDGDDGAPGLKGEPGNDGDDGAPGLKGEPDNDGDDGAPGEKGEPGNDGDIDALMNRITVLERKPFILACGNFLWDGATVNLYNVQEVNIASTDSAGTPFNEDGHYEVIFETPRGNGDNLYIVHVQPLNMNGKYKLSAEIMTMTNVGFTFRLSGFSPGTYDAFGISVIYYGADMI